MSRVPRLVRVVLVAWLGLAIVVWNGLYDLRITLGVRDYLMKAALSQAGRGPDLVMADAMRATVADAVMVASLWAAIVLAAGWITIFVMHRRPARA